MMEYINMVDEMILEGIKTNMNSGIMDVIMPLVSFLGNNGAIWIAITLCFIISKKYRQYGIALGIALILCLVIGDMTLKPLFGRMRPFCFNNDIILLVKKPLDFSFPSGHSMSSFAAATVIFFANKKMGIAAAILAGLIAFSRLYLYVHYPSDVVVGILLGISIGAVAVYFTKAIKLKFDENNRPLNK